MKRVVVEIMAKVKAMKAWSSSSDSQLVDEIKKKAREIYEASGRKPGRDLDNWLEAERIVKSKGCGC